jgi:molybdopterin molybdotransferase
VPGGRPLRPAELGLLAAAGVTSVPVHRRPRVAIVSTGDEVVPPDTADLRPAQVRDATARRWPDWSPTPAVSRSTPASSRTSAARWRRPFAGLLDEPTSSSCPPVVGRRRDETTGAVSALGDGLVPRLAIKPGKPTLLAECRGYRSSDCPEPAVRAGCVPPGRHAAGLVGSPAAHRRHRSRPPAPGCPATCLAAGRLDVVQVRVRDGVAEPVFGPSALLSVLARADGYVVVPEPATGLDGARTSR